MEDEPYRPLCGVKSVFNDRKPKAESRKLMENEPIDPGALYVFNNRKPKAEN